MSDITVIHLLYTADPSSPPDVSEAFGYLKGDENGALWMRPIATLGGGATAIQTARNPDSDSVLASNVTSFDTSCFLFGWDGFNYDRIRVAGNNASSFAEITSGVLQSMSYPFAYNTSTGTYTRLRAAGNNVDAEATNALGLAETASYLKAYNGATYDRLRSSGNDANSRSPVTLGLLESVSYLYGYDAEDDNWDRIRTFRTDQDSVSQSNNGALKCLAAIQGFNGSTFDRITIGSLTGDNDSPAAKGAVKTKAHGYHYNGAGFDRVRGNTQQTIFASAAYVATQNSGNLINYNARGIILTIDVTAIVDTPSVVFTIQGYDPTSGTYNTIIASAAITAVGTTHIHAYPGLAKTAGVEENHVLPRNYQILATHADADSITYSVGEQLIV